ncbi:MAG: tetratricopeptide repeat protein, partial [Pirellulales bacterium]|nr:tetratricopeptide repeat protein [Pirellulales bacterium]
MAFVLPLREKRHKQGRQYNCHPNNRSGARTLGNRLFQRAVSRRADVPSAAKLHCLSLFMFPLLCLCLTISAAASPAPAPLVFDDAPELLAPRRPRTEADRDHIEALALWATGRTHQQNKEYAKALRCYQRALRFDPRSPEIVQAIIPVADRLNRHAIAARYALIDVELKDADPMLLRRLAVFLAGKGDWTSAAALYEKAVAVRKNAKQSAADVFLRMEMGRLYLLMEKYEQAAECFAHVVNAVEHPDEFALDAQLSKALLDDPGRTYQLMGECFLAADRPEDARAAFRKAEEHSINSATRQCNLARVNAQTDKPAEALEAMEACFAEKGDRSDLPQSGPKAGTMLAWSSHKSDLSPSGQGTAPYETLADVLEKLGKKDELIGRLEKLHAAEPNNLPLGYFLAARLRDAGQTDRAESLYRKLLDGKPMLIGYRELADILRRAKRFDALLSVLGESVEKIGVLNTLGGEEQTISSDGESLRGLVDAARKSIGKTPDKPAFCKALAVAVLALEAKRFETAGEFFGLALEADPQRADETLMLWGVGLLSGNRAAEAVVVFRRAIDQTAQPSGGPAFHFYLAGALALEGRVDEALAAA